MQDMKKIVTLKSIFESLQWQNSSAKLPLAVGRNNDGEAVVLDLARLPHLLIAGMTEQLEDSGDMIFMSFGNTNCQYVRGAFASEQTKSRIIDSVKSDSVQESDTVSSETRKYFREGDNQEFLRVLSWALEEPGKITPSYLQRVLEIGYNQAAEYMDILRERGVIPPAK